MRKYRSWLMGLGIGLILGASMLQLILIAKDQEQRVAGEQPISRERLDAEAKKAGLVILPADARTYTQEELDAKVAEAVAAAESSKIDSKSTPKLPPAQAKDTNRAKEPKIVTLNVRSNMPLSTVANELQKLGVIEDADDFVKKAESIATKLEIGTSVFVGKPTYKQIMAELTRSKD